MSEYKFVNLGVISFISPSFCTLQDWPPPGFFSRDRIRHLIWWYICCPTLTYEIILELYCNFVEPGKVEPRTTGFLSKHTAKFWERSSILWVFSLERWALKVLPSPFNLLNFIGLMTGRPTTQNTYERLNAPVTFEKSGMSGITASTEIEGFYVCTVHLVHSFYFNQQRKIYIFVLTIFLL